MKVGVFGGSFDPPHMGHVFVCTWILQTTDIDSIVVVPTWHHAFDKEFSENFQVRMDLCRLGFAHDPRIVVSDIEGRLQGTSRTFETLIALKSEQPHDTFRLIVGSDIISQTDRWYRWDDVIKMAPPIVVEREAYPFSKDPAIVVPNVSSTELRRRLLNGENVKGWVPQAVLNEITDRGLYGTTCV